MQSTKLDHSNFLGGILFLLLWSPLSATFCNTVAVSKRFVTTRGNLGQYKSLTPDNGRLPTIWRSHSPKHHVLFSDLRGELDGGSKDTTTNDEIVQDRKFVERNKYWIVLVDDEEAIRNSVGDYLYDQGYQVAACADADAFFEVCELEATDGASQAGLPRIPDLIVSDIRMPGKDGLELLRMLRADDRLSRVPVILLTAKGLTQDRVAGYKAGATAYLSKPFNPEELLCIADNAIQRRKQMSGRSGFLVDMKQEMADIKLIMQQNSAQVVQKTSVYLTAVEREVLDLVSEGYTNQEIAKQRKVSLDGINKMIQKLYDVTETNSRTELVRWAIKTGYVSSR